MNDAAAIRIRSNATRSGFRLEAEQFLPAPVETVFAIFSDAFQLERLTPAWLNFRIVTPAPIKIVQGTLIDYRLRLHGIPLRWQSRISEWSPPHRFVDEQTRGPYRSWHHEHLFESRDGGTLCRDIVDYSVYGGRLIHALFVRPDLLKIFAHRREQLAQVFASSGGLGLPKTATS